MLILTRNPGETLYIGDDIRITVLEVRGNQVRIGIAAPNDMSVHREEIYRAIQRQQGQGSDVPKPPSQTAGVTISTKRRISRLGTNVRGTRETNDRNS